MTLKPTPHHINAASNYIIYGRFNDKFLVSKIYRRNHLNEWQFTAETRKIFTNRHIDTHREVVIFRLETVVEHRRPLHAGRIYILKMKYNLIEPSSITLTNFIQAFQKIACTFRNEAKSMLSRSSSFSKSLRTM